MKFSLQLSCVCLMAWLGGILGQDVVRVVVKEDSDAILNYSVSPKVDLRLNVFDLKKDDQRVFLYDAGHHYNNGKDGQDEQFKGRVSYFEDELKDGNVSVKISKTKVSDSGNYSCDFPYLQPSQTFIIELVVVASPRPRLRILETPDGVMLQCEVRGASPKHKVEWRDSAGNIVHAEEPQVTERGGSYDIILKAKLTKSDTYRCVVTQEEINHRTEAETFVPLNESHTGLIAGLVVAGVLALVVCFLLYKLNCKKDTRRGIKEVKTEKREEEPMLEERIQMNGSRQQTQSSSDDSSPSAPLTEQSEDVV